MKVDPGLHRDASREATYVNIILYLEIYISNLKRYNLLLIIEALLFVNPLYVDINTLNNNQ